MSVEKYTLDTNILVYSIDRQAGKRHRKSIELINKMTRCDCILTLQALCEFFSAVTCKNKMPYKDAQDQVNDWMILFPVVSTRAAALQRAMQAVDKHQFSFWDSVLIETAVHAGVTQFISEDMQHGQQWKGMLIHNPFL